MVFCGKLEGDIEVLHRSCQSAAKKVYFKQATVVYFYFYEPVCSFDIQYKVSLPNTRHEMTNISPALYM